MMDFNILIIIACVFLASLFSLLIINRFFKRKTFEEIVAEKKALTEKIYGQSKSGAKKPKKVQQQLKKDQKRERKHRQKERQPNTSNEKEQEESDEQSEHPSATEDEPTLEGLSKMHVEFEPDPEVVTFNNNNNNESVPVDSRRASNADGNKDGSTVANPPAAAIKLSKTKKDKKGAKSGGILLNKNEPVAVKDTLAIDEQLNNFEAKHPKDVIELKKQEKEKMKEVKETKDEKPTTIQSIAEKPAQAKKEKVSKKDKQAGDPPALESVGSVKEVKNLEEKLVRQNSPKQQSSSKLSSKTKKQIKESAATRDLVVSLDKLSDNDTIGVALLMDLFRRAELTRSEIQILIDYLLNKQQDMPHNHSEWSDDICQKLKRQLEEKERLLAEEQEASLGIQAKMRDLRSEINAERAQMAANTRAYMDKIQSKDQELTALNQDLQALNEKIALERSQFQTKLLQEKQAGNQDLMSQLQIMQNELAHKDKCITELTCMMNASHQANEEVQQKSAELANTQAQQIHALEQLRDELEEVSNKRIFEMEQTKTLETQNSENKVEILNLQNALESANTDLHQARKELETVSTELEHVRKVELVEKQSEIESLRAKIADIETAFAELKDVRRVELAGKQNELEALQGKNTELRRQIAELGNASEDMSRGKSDLQNLMDMLKADVEQKEQELQAFNLRNSEIMRELNEARSECQERDREYVELKETFDMLKTEAVEKDLKLLAAEQAEQNIRLKEKDILELLQQLQEQKEKNNEQQLLLSAAQKSISTATTTTAADSSQDEQQIRDLFQRLYPDAVKTCASSALTLSFEKWAEQVVAAHIKQLAAVATNTSTKSTQSTSNSSSNSHSQTNSDGEPAEHNVGRGANTSQDDEGEEAAEVQRLRLHNAELRADIDKLSQIVNKATNTVSDLENRVHEQDEHWSSIVRSKDELIHSLQHSNGEQDI